MAFTAMLLALFPAFYIATRREGAHYKELEHAAGRAFPAAPARADSSKERVPSAVPASHGSLVAEMINEKYGVQVVMNDERYPVKLYSGLINATDAQSPDLDRYCTVLAQEFLLYPPGLIRRSRLTKIVLCRALSYNGQTRAAAPDFEHDALYLDVLKGSYSSIYQRVVIHHEQYHIIDYQETRAYALRMNLAAMVPHDELASTKHCLADPGREYLLYLPDGADAVVDLSLGSGPFRLEWTHPADGRITTVSGIAGGGRNDLCEPRLVATRCFTS